MLSYSLTIFDGTFILIGHRLSPYTLFQLVNRPFGFTLRLKKSSQTMADIRKAKEIRK
ncbi:hypothetical protein OKIT_0907 [Oenococcus kitaharae DSM 17330]|uniref:Uncharacterized protein n=1 Tax=Oenococcus kitaharae DSM 17330 TaxID=1045004 RepID=G9WJG7_9LACO|nr:hypothetical protein OKIT_0907 [Oenococcus kitaharae DSM 17330]